MDVNLSLILSVEIGSKAIYRARLSSIRNSILSQSFDREFQHVKCVMAKEELRRGWMVKEERPLPMLCSSR